MEWLTSAPTTEPMVRNCGRATAPPTARRWSRISTPAPPARRLRSLTNVDGTLYFVAHDGSGSNQLWKSDGTAGGTSVVQSFTPAQTQSSNPSYLSVVNGTLYFSANDGIHGTQLWKSDGTAAGTTMVTDLPQNSVVISAEHVQPGRPDGAIFFEAGSASSGPVSTIYRTDGTPGGTSAIFTPDSSASQHDRPHRLWKLPLFSHDGIQRFGTAVDLWKSDGTSSGTTLVASIPNSYSYWLSGTLTDVNGKVFFAVDIGSTDDGQQPVPTLVERRHRRGHDRSHRSERTSAASRGAGERAGLHPARLDGLG